MNVNEILNFILNPQISGGLLIFKMVMIFFSFFFFSASLYFFLRTSWWRRIFWQDFYEFITFKSYEEKRWIKVWKKILKRLESDIEAEQKLAILEADEMLNKVLEEIGIQGKEIEEKIKNLPPALIPNLQELKEVRKLRDNIVHDPSFKISFEETKRAILVYQKVFKELDAI